MKKGIKFCNSSMLNFILMEILITARKNFYSNWVLFESRNSSEDCS